MYDNNGKGVQESIFRILLDMSLWIVKKYRYKGDLILDYISALLSRLCCLLVTFQILLLTMIEGRKC